MNGFTGRKGPAVRWAGAAAPLAGGAAAAGARGAGGTGRPGPAGAVGAGGGVPERSGGAAAGGAAPGRGGAAAGGGAAGPAERVPPAARGRACVGLRGGGAGTGPQPRPGVPWGIRFHRGGERARRGGAGEGGGLFRDAAGGRGRGRRGRRLPPPVLAEVVPRTPVLLVV